ncbi:uncharacterized protein LOC122509760 [Leptopilina heterotoma]|uniref:uncharacterized protein LOC122509760 n=1 Tax=Leptopilina heterotoma TaxID=63436 RepID=UPI001CA9EF8C|nr:uncharacterized protein LOC122509760 [Leptopilina heterotoma]
MKITPTLTSLEDRLLFVQKKESIRGDGVTQEIGLDSDPEFNNVSLEPRRRKRKFLTLQKSPRIVVKNQLNEPICVSSDEEFDSESFQLMPIDKAGQDVQYEENVQYPAYRRRKSHRG